jgi:predicted RNA methylase
MNADDVNLFPGLSCEERSRYIEKQQVLIRSLIEEFGLEREVHFTTFNPPFGTVYEGALVGLLELDLVIYEIIYDHKKREVYYFYVRNFPGGTMIPVCAD